MADPDIQMPNQTSEPSHLVVEQGLFSRSSSAGIPNGTQPIAAEQQYSTEIPADIPLDEAAAESVENNSTTYENGGGSPLMLIRQNLFWVLLIPMIIIEIVLLITVVRG